MSVVYLNGAYLPAAEAMVPVDDRGFLFADGIYEVAAAYEGRWLRLDAHLARMASGLAALSIDFDPASLVAVHDELLRRNGLANAPAAIVYVQVTRGVAPRSHAFPTPAVAPTVYAFAKEFRRPDPVRWSEGYSAITVPDPRWARCDIKSIALLPNVLAQQSAVAAGVDDALFVKDGIAIEGAHNNLFAVFGGTAVTYPKSNYILPGITRDLVLDLARARGIPVEERPIRLESLWDADELFTTGTTTEVRPIVSVDGRRVGGGRVGAVARTLHEAFSEAVGALASGAVT
ncbi:MAG: aminotransferase class IV [Gemmatimonadota bacterium]